MKKEYRNLILTELIIIIIAIIAIMFLKSEYVNLVPKCIVREKLGIMCPACDGTKFAIELANFNIVKAFKMHPMFFILALYFGIINLFYIINTLSKKDIKIFRWWHIVIWTILLIIYTIIKNILYWRG